MRISISNVHTCTYTHIKCAHAYAYTDVHPPIALAAPFLARTIGDAKLGSAVKRSARKKTKTTRRKVCVRVADYQERGRTKAMDAHACPLPAMPRMPTMMTMKRRMATMRRGHYTVLG